MKVYLFGWPGDMGGATTKFTHLLTLLSSEFDITVVPTFDWFERDTRWSEWLKHRKIAVCHPENLPQTLDAWGIALCNEEFLGGPLIPRFKRRGLKLAWGNEMMWSMRAEAGAMMLGYIDTLLYVSPQQRAALEPEYRRLAKGSLQPGSSPVDLHRKAGWLREGTRRVRWHMVGNYVDATFFPFRNRAAGADRCLTIGRLSRPDPLKFPEDFPDFYEGLGLENVRFRVMAWDHSLRKIWPDDRFDERWELLAAGGDPSEFLRSLDLFVYDVGPAFRESWGRTVAEAMLSGAIPLVPKGGGHHLEDLVVDGRCGFVCGSRSEFAERSNILAKDHELRRKMSFEARKHALNKYSNREAHLKIWRRVLRD